MSEYIFEINDALFDEKTGKMVMKPKVNGELIRCRDCKKWEKTWTDDFPQNYHYCSNVDGIRDENFYCADAERREE